ncbi:hypothetical protein TNCV_3923011 [Trichonephila clavipes]|nr:hypothetical protein TNCV_3923011 [Trichonephila clavipes]
MEFNPPTAEWWGGWWGVPHKNFEKSAKKSAGGGASLNRRSSSCQSADVDQRKAFRPTTDIPIEDRNLRWSSIFEEQKPMDHSEESDPVQ